MAAISFVSYNNYVDRRVVFQVVCRSDRGWRTILAVTTKQIGLSRSQALYAAKSGSTPETLGLQLSDIYFAPLIVMTYRIASCFYRAMHYSAKHGLAVTCRLSVRL